MTPQANGRTTARPQRVLLVGGGHSHVEVLRRFALRRDENVALTLVSPDPALIYTGMLPGLVAGHYTVPDAQIALEPLALWAGARFITDRVVALDLYTKTATLYSGDREPFDLISIDVGATSDLSVPGARGLALTVKPMTTFLGAWSAIQADAASGVVQTIGVVGGGVGGVEILLAMQYRLQAAMGAGAPRFALITEAPSVVPQQPPMVRAVLGRILVERGVVLHLQSGAMFVEPGSIVASHGRRIAVDRMVWATAAAAQPWMAAAGLACDERGFIRTDDHLCSTSHPFVFAVGDCATQLAHPRPKSGVFAVRQGPPLAANLRRAVYNVPLRKFVPQRHALALISTGGRHALGARGAFAVEGDWVWRWKDRIDRRFVARYALPVGVPEATAEASVK
ncbi:MAG: FAD-dependent oxidoreductase [Casimicrobiaceae bacterium]